jgi:tetratricopeptide (TPR) repeat protein
MNIQELRGHRWLGLVVVLALGTPIGAVPLRAADPAAPSQPSEEERRRLEKQAAELNQSAVRFAQQGRYAEATKALEQAVEMYQRLYPADQYPQGHPLLANSLNGLGFLLQERGEYGRALGYYKQALEMFQRLYPTDKYPQGHPHLATSLDNLGGLLQERGEYGRALGYK